MTHLLVTNDFPPKVGGIQSYLWELWRRLPPDRFTVLTTSYPGAARFDADQQFQVVRANRVLMPTPGLLRRVEEIASQMGADAIVVDPALPLGLIGPRLGLPYGVVLHGAEVTVPARLPGTRQALYQVLSKASRVIAASDYAAAEARGVAGEHLPPTTVVPPGVDPSRFRPLTSEQRAKVRADFGLHPDGCLIVSVSRLVPRKGMDVLIKAAALIARERPDLTLAIGGKGRDRRRLERLAARHRSPARLLGAVSDDRLPALYGCADVFAMPCRRRWAGLDQEGFGIVFLEAAACGVPQVAGDSGGAREAVIDGRTGLVVEEPEDVNQVAAALERLLSDPGARSRMGREARERASSELSYDVLARRLDEALVQLEDQR